MSEAVWRDIVKWVVRDDTRKRVRKIDPGGNQDSTGWERQALVANSDKQAEWLAYRSDLT